MAFPMRFIKESLLSSIRNKYTIHYICIRQKYIAYAFCFVPFHDSMSNKRGRRRGTNKTANISQLHRNDNMLNIHYSLLSLWVCALACVSNPNGSVFFRSFLLFFAARFPLYALSSSCLFHLAMHMRLTKKKYTIAAHYIMQTAQRIKEMAGS